MKDLKINDSHLDQIQHLLAQSMNGIHLLFDNETIRRILREPTDEMRLFDFKNLDKIQNLFTEFVRRETFDGKLKYLSSLDHDSYELLLRTYFHIVENSLAAADPKH